MRTMITDQVMMEIESTHDYNDDFVKVYLLNKSTQYPNPWGLLVLRDT